MSKPKKSSEKSTQITVDEFIAGLKSAGGSEKYHQMQESVLRRLLEFTDKRKVRLKPFRKSIVNDYLCFCGIPGVDSGDDVKGTKRRIQGIMRKLCLFHSDGIIARIRKSIPLSIPRVYQTVFDQYVHYRQHEKILAPRTLRLCIRETSRFLNYLVDLKVTSLSRIQPKHIDAYFRMNLNLAPRTVATKASHLRELLRFFVINNKVTPKILVAVPQVHYIKRSRLPDVWPEDSVEKLIANIDHASPLGKRDYAICLLIAQLGLRVGDVRELLLDDIDWNKATINISQQKTKQAQALPLPEKVGEAIIDYMKNGRPRTRSRKLFVSHNAPFCEFGKNNNLHHIIDKYRSKAKILLPKECRRGFHSLRHSIATRLHEADVPISTIASLLGHASLETTRYYAKANIEQLRKAALEWEEELS